MPIATPEIYVQMLDPRSWGKAAEASMTARVQQACEDLMFTGKQLS
jgi:fructose/tagatose bisphosphate aldolase